MEVYISPARPDVSEIDANCTYVFLAGGISKCWDWQDQCCELIQEIAKDKAINTDNLILFNPRRLSFDVSDKTASDEQITWEYDYLNLCDIFSMYFCESDSVQPICLYELGHYVPGVVSQYSNYRKALQHIVVTAESNYARCYDVEKQLELCLGPKEKSMIFDKNEHSKEAIRSHANRILNAYIKNQLNKEIENMTIA